MLLALACVFLFGCHGPSGGGQVPLSLNSLYSPDSVRMALYEGDGQAAEKKMAEAIDRFKKQKDTAGSVPLFKAAILLKPTARGYYELSGALLMNHQYPEAIQALRIAERLGYSPLANVMFRYSYSYAGMMDSQMPQLDSHVTDSALQYMELALQMGYSRPRDFLRKEIFPLLTANYRFQRVYNAAFSGMEGRDPQKSLWESYYTQYPETNLPLIINGSWIRTHQLENQISFEFEKFVPEMRDHRFEREGGTVYYYIALIKKDPAWFAVLYGAQDESEESYEQHADSTMANTPAVQAITPMFYLVTYDLKGKLIDKMAVAGRNDLTQPFKAFAIQSSMHFQVQDFTDDFKSDSTATTSDSLKSIAIKPQLPVNYEINSAGKFVRTDAPMAAR